MPWLIWLLIVLSAQIGSKCSGIGKLPFKRCRTAAASGYTIWALQPASEAICVVEANVSRGVSSFFMLSSASVGSTTVIPLTTPSSMLSILGGVVMYVCCQMDILMILDRSHVP